MHQILISAAAPPRPRWGAHSAAPDPLAGFKRSYFQGKGKKWKGKGEGNKGERERGVEPPPLQISGYATGDKLAFVK